MLALRTVRAASPRCWLPRASAAACARHASAAPSGSGTVKITFVKPGGQRVVVDAKIGDSMLEVSQAHKIDIEGA